MKIIGINTGTLLPKQVYLMADSAVIRSNKPFFVPRFAGHFTGTAAIVLHIDRLGKHIAPRFAHRYCHAVSSAIKVSACGLTVPQPCEPASALATSFDGALLLGDSFNIADAHSINNAHITVSHNDDSITASSLSEMGINFSEVIAQLSVFFTLKMGDMIVIELQGLDAELNQGDSLAATLNGEPNLVIRVK